MTSATHAAVRGASERLRDHAVTLWEAGPQRRARALGKSFAALADARGDASLRETLARSSGLSPEGVQWALRTSIEPMTETALLSLSESIPPPHRHARAARPGHLLAVVLSSNVFTASARGLAFPLLLGWPVLAKASARDAAFPEAFQRALHEADEELAGALEVHAFARGDEDAERILLEQADAVAVYGSDNTLNELRGRLRATTTFIPHGHGLGVALVGGDAVTSTACAQDAARALALDVAAYDQRGCLSPHTVWVQRGGAVDGRKFAKLLFDALGERATSMPRGSLPVEAGATQVQWRGVGVARGELLEGDGHSVCFEGGEPLRIGPGYRNVQVLETSSLQHFGRAVAPLGIHLKAVGVAGVATHEVAAALPAVLAPQVGALGEMQSPPLDVTADGQPWWHGLVRWVDVR